MLAEQGVLVLVLNENDPYADVFFSTLSIRFGAGFLLISSMSIFSLLWYGQEEQKDLASRKTEAEQLSKDAELFKLRQQLQPHFLFNSLNSISALTIVDPESHYEHPSWMV